MSCLRISNPAVLAVSVIAICFVVTGSNPSQTHAKCDVPPYRSDAIQPRGTAKLVNAPRAIRSSKQKLRIAWEEPGLEDPVIRWFNGCRTGQFLPTSWRRTAADRQGRFFSSFADLRAPRGSLELWAEFSRYSADWTDSEMAYLGKARVARTISRTELSVVLEIGPTLTPVPEIHTSVTVTHQQKLTIRERVVAQVCNDKSCSARELFRGRSVSPGRRFQRASEFLSYAEEQPTDTTTKRFETSFQPRFLPSVTRKFDETTFKELCTAIRAGSRVVLELTATARRADGRGKARSARRRVALEPSLCPPSS